MGYARSDSQAEHQAGVAQLRAGGRGRGGAVVGMIGSKVPVLERPDALDVSRMVLLKRGKTVLLPSEDATDITKDLTAPLRQIQSEFGPDAIRWMHANADALREQYQPLLAGQSAAVAQEIDPDLATAFIDLINEQ